MEPAADSYALSLQTAPNFIEARHRLGQVRLLQKKYAEAEAQFREILKLNADDVDAHKALGYTLARQEKDQEARDEYEQVLKVQPYDETSSKDLAGVTQKMEAEQSLTNLLAGLKIQPTPEVLAQIASLEDALGKYQEAVNHLQSALDLKSDSPEIENNLAWLLATCPAAAVRDGGRAVQLAEHACEETQFAKTIYLGTLAAAQAEAGRFDDAIATARKACATASAHGETALFQRNQELLTLYQHHQAWHEPGRLVPAPPASSFESVPE